MNGRPYRPHGPIAPMAEVEQVGRTALWVALAAFVLFAAIVGGGSLVFAHVPHETPRSP